MELEALDWIGLAESGGVLKTSGKLEHMLGLRDNPGITITAEGKQVLAVRCVCNVKPLFGGIYPWRCCVSFFSEQSIAREPNTSLARRDKHFDHLLLILPIALGK
jgi:hypothetical protein